MNILNNRNLKQDVSTVRCSNTIPVVVVSAIFSVNMPKKFDEEKSERHKPATRNMMDVVKSKTTPPSASKAPSLAKKSSPQQHSNTATGGSEEYIKNKSSFKLDDDARGAKTADDTPSLDKHGGWLHPLEDKADVVERKPKR
uniref:Uncharacterized protein n=1 Tax=Romanomermis culicivorax TaxID=13658 RepID=A0A915K1G8_ROMCU